MVMMMMMMMMLMMVVVLLMVVMVMIVAMQNDAIRYTNDTEKWLGTHFTWLSGRKARFVTSRDSL